jgi:MFS family permease
MARNRWFILALLFLARTAMGLQFQCVGSVAPFLVDSIGIQYAAAGTLIGLYLLPGVFISLPGGMLGERFGAKRIVGGLVMGVSQSFATLACGRLLSGTGAVLMNVLLTKMVADWFAGREIATAMAILVTSWPFGIALGLLGFVPLAAWLGWPAVMTVAALVCVPCLLAVAGEAVPARFELNLTAREWLLVSFAGFVWATYNVGYIVLVSFLPGYFTSRGYALVQASALVSWLGWTLMVFVPAGGYLADRLGRPDAVMLGGFVLTGIAAACLATGALPMMLAFGVIAFAVGPPAGPIMALPASALRMHNRATGMGIYFTWYYALMATFPALAGLARDITQSSATPLLFAVLMMAFAVAGVVGFRLAARMSKTAAPMPR